MGCNQCILPVAGLGVACRHSAARKATGVHGRAPEVALPIQTHSASQGGPPKCRWDFVCRTTKEVSLLSAYLGLLD